MSSHPLVDALVSTCQAYGVQHACIGAGSRSTPLIESLNAHGVTIHAWLDERSVGYMALGLAKASACPVMVVTTSGTAVSNVYPAITESAKGLYPLIVCSGDRPSRFSETSANQTIDQVNIFNNVVAELQMPESDACLHDWRKQVQHACHRQSENGGPIHINCPLEDPVAYPYVPPLECNISCVQLEKECHMDADIESVVQSATSGVLCIGQCEPWVKTSDLEAIITKLGWPTIVDATHHALKQLPGVAHSADAAALAWLSVSFDCVLYLGGAWVSKHMASFFNHHRSVVYHASAAFLPVVPLVNHTIRGTLSIPLSSGVPATVNVEQLNNAIQDNHDTSRLDTTEFDRMADLLDRIVGPVDCFVSNSLPIRYMDQLSSACIRRCYSNRGASGIDGNIATIVGIGLVPDTVPLLGIVGDLTAIYDLNAWMLLHRVQRPLTIVVINNGGGAIFDRLPISKSYDAYHEHVKLSHTIQLTPILQSMGVPCTVTDGPITPTFSGDVFEWVFR